MDRFEEKPTMGRGRGRGRGWVREAILETERKQRQRLESQNFRGVEITSNVAACLRVSPFAETIGDEVDACVVHHKPNSFVASEVSDKGHEQQRESQQDGALEITSNVAAGASARLSPIAVEDKLDECIIKEKPKSFVASEVADKEHEQRRESQQDGSSEKISNVAAGASARLSPIAETIKDKLDGCIIKEKPKSFVASEAVVKEEDLGSATSAVVSTSTISNADNKESLGTLFRIKKSVPILVLSVDYSERCVKVKFIRNERIVKGKVCLYESSLTKKWKKDHQFVFTSKIMEEKVLLNTFDLSLGKNLIARQVMLDNNAEYFLFIDVFSDMQLSNDFMMSLLFMLVPRTPRMGLHKLALITNVAGRDEISVALVGGTDTGTWMGLREALHALQEQNNWFSPRCPSTQEFHKELVLGFNVAMFLAPLNDDWSELHRVKIIGTENDEKLSVVYIDLGKLASLRFKDLVSPLTTDFMPQLLEKIPPQAFTVRVHGLNREYDKVTKLIRASLERRVCYIQEMSDDPAMPSFNVFLSNLDDNQTLHLSELVSSLAEKRMPTPTGRHNHDQLRSLEQKLAQLRKKMTATFKDRVKQNIGTSCTCSTCASSEKTPSTVDSVSEPDSRRRMMTVTK